MLKGIGCFAALLALAGCAVGPETGSDVGYVADTDAPSVCELSGGTALAANAGASCGQQVGGENCIWSPMAVERGAQDAGADCNGRACACVTQGNIHEACAAGAPACVCPEGSLDVGGASGCTEIESLERNFDQTEVGALIRNGVWMMYRGGAIDTVARYADATQLIEAHPYLATTFEQSCALELGRTDHDCDTGFEKEAGCFLDATGAFAGVSERMADLIAYADKSYDEDTQGAAREVEGQVIASVTVVDGKLKLYFGRDDDGWRLLVIDATAFDCGG